MACELHDDIIKRQDQHQSWIDELRDEITQLKIAVARTNDNIARIFKDVDEIKVLLAAINLAIQNLTIVPEAKGNNKWEGLKEKVLYLIVGALVMYIVGKLLP